MALILMLHPLIPCVDTSLVSELKHTPRLVAVLAPCGIEKLLQAGAFVNRSEVNFAQPGTFWASALAHGDLADSAPF
jgi:hypothetical protein